MAKLKFLTLGLVAFSGIIYLLYVFYIYSNQVNLVFMHSGLEKTHAFHFDTPFEEKYIASFDGKKQHGILFTTENPKGIIFYLHGNAGNVSEWGDISSYYTSLGYDFFILDYRSYGKSEGEIEDQEQVVQDVRIVYDAITKEYVRKIIMGYSIGTGIAAQLAASRPASILVLQAPYDNFLAFTRSKVPYFPDFLKKFSLETDKVITHIPYSIYIFHGKEDQLIPVDNAIRLKALCKPTDSLFLLEHQEHNGINENEQFKETLSRLLK